MQFGSETPRKRQEAELEVVELELEWAGWVGSGMIPSEVMTVNVKWFWR